MAVTSISHEVLHGHTTPASKQVHICVLDHDSDGVYANYLVSELQGKSHFILLGGKNRNQSHCDKETGQGAHR